jgi:CRP/FNR family transcriptional regulator, cyclic AMP receptor protein
MYKAKLGRHPYTVQKLERFLDNYHTKSFSKGELILVQGEVPTCLYVIRSGVVKTYNLTSQGEEKPIMYDIKSEMFPIGWIYRKLKYAQYYYEAFTDCEVYCVPRDDFTAFIKKNPDELYEIFSYFVGRYLNYQMRINALEQSKAHSKVINTLHFLCLRFGRDIKENTVRIELPFTQQDLANLIGLTRETTGIELKKLQRQGLLTYKKQYYIVRTDKLEELLDEDYDSGRLPEDEITLKVLSDKTSR